MMPTVSIQFNLPEEMEEFEIATNAAKYKSSIDSIFDILRSAIKYNHKWEGCKKELTEHDIDLLESIREAFRNVCDFS